jgi:amino acid efflux transporter
VGALLGPSLLLLPGIAADLAGPAALLAWAVLLGLSALIAVVFCVLGTSFGSTAGVAGYAASGLRPSVGTATGWAFTLGVVTGVPVVCLIGGQYIAAATGLSHYGTAIAAILLLLVLAVRFFGGTDGTRLQLPLVAVLLVLLVVAVAGSVCSAKATNWHPFLPHGPQGVFRAAGHLMMAFVGWEAAAPLTTRLANPQRQLPRVIAAAFLLTTVTYLSLASVLQAVLGPAAATTTPLSALMEVAVGPAGPWCAAVAALLLTLGVANAYLHSATATAEHLLNAGTSERHRAPVPLLTTGAAAFGALLLGLSALGAIDLTMLVALPTAFFLVVYLTCCLSATRLLSGGGRAAAAVATTVTAGLLAATGIAAVVVLVAVAAVTVANRAMPNRHRGPRDRA